MRFPDRTTILSGRPQETQYVLPAVDAVILGVSLDRPPRMLERAGSASRWFASHELRTPLQAIKGGVELLLAERGSGLSALQIEALGLIAGAAGELEHCVDMLAELAALESAFDISLAPHALGTWLAEPAIAHQLQPTGRVAAAAGLHVLIAPPLMARALQHLRTASAAAESAAPLACDLVAIASDTCVLGLACDEGASGNGAVARQLAAALFAQGGASLKMDDSPQALLTLRRAV